MPHTSAEVLSQNVLRYQVIKVKKCIAAILEKE